MGGGFGLPNEMLYDSWNVFTQLSEWADFPISKVCM